MRLWILWLTLASACFCLKLGKYAPMDIWRKFGLLPGSIAALLHNIKLDPSGLRTVIALLKHQDIPFDSIYNDSCGIYMNRNRFDSLLAALVAAGSKHWPQRYLLLSVDCLAVSDNQNGVSIFQSEDINLLGPDYLFANSLVTMLPVFNQPRTYYEQMAAAIKNTKSDQHPLVLPHCAFLQSDQVPMSLFTKSAAKMLGYGASSWMAFHWSCFEISNGRRFSLILSWLLRERPIDESMSCGCIEDGADLLRWSSHLCLILTNIPMSEDGSGFALGLPLRLHLVRLQTHLKTLEGKTAEFPIALVLRATRKIITVVLSAWRATGEDSFRPQIPYFGHLDYAITIGIDDERIKATWRLNLAYLYLKMRQGTDLAIPTAEQLFPQASPQEQLPILKIGHLQLFQIGVETMATKKELQKLTVQNWEQVPKHILHTIPLRARFKEVRRFLYKESGQISQFLDELDLPVSDARAIVDGILGRIDAFDFWGLWLFHLRDRTEATLIGLLLSTAIIFNITIRVDVAQASIIFSDDEFDEDYVRHAFPFVGAVSAGTLDSRIWAAMRTSRALIPFPLLTTSEASSIFS